MKMEKYYVLRKNEYYLSDIMTDENDKLVNFAIDTEYRKLYSDYELAEQDRRLIYIETGLNFEIEKFRKEDLQNED